MTSTALELLVGIALALPVHEAGHLCAARLLGAADVRLERVGLWGAAVRAQFADDARGPRALFLLAGALANAVAGVLAFALGGELVAGIQWLCAVLLLVPTRDSDGARLLSLVAGRR